MQRIRHPCRFDSSARSIQPQMPRLQQSSEQQMESNRKNLKMVRVRWSERIHGAKTKKWQSPIFVTGMIDTISPNRIQQHTFPDPGRPKTTNRDFSTGLKASVVDNESKRIDAPSNRTMPDKDFKSIATETIVDTGTNYSPKGSLVSDCSCVSNLLMEWKVRQQHVFYSILIRYFYPSNQAHHRRTYFNEMNPAGIHFFLRVFFSFVQINCCETISCSLRLCLYYLFIRI